MQEYTWQRVAHDVTNLVMIGTPNAGAPLASPSDSCKPAALDIHKM